jgi:predicted Zn-dependent protease
MYLIEGGAWLNLGRLDDAEKAARAGIAADTQSAYPRLRKLLGEALSRKHQYTAAAEELDSYLAAVPDAPDAAQVNEAIARNRKLAAILGK